MKKRSANLELLRIVAMFMIISLHYLGKGETLVAVGADNFTLNSGVAWFLEACFAGAINLYVLISGYFLVSSDFHIEKGIKIWMQVLFYSLLIFAVMMAIGQVPKEELSNVYFLALFFLPLTTKHYWFASVYLVFYLLSPFLAAGVKALSKKQLKTLIVILFVFYTTLLPTIIPTTSVYDDRGFGIVWFVTLFAIAAYIRLYVNESDKKGKYLLVYLISSILIFGSMFFVTFIYQKTGKLSNLLTIFYNYNSPLMIIGSTSLFLLFRNLKIKEGFFSNAIVKIGGLTFGIYLLHEHYLLRDLWIDFWKVDQFYEKPYFIIHYLIVAILVFSVCALAEYLRQLLFNLLYRSKLWKAFVGKISGVDGCFNKNKED